jgi:hypothetical protein
MRPHQLQHLAARRFHHSPHLPVAAFVDRDLDVRITLGIAHAPRCGRTRGTIAQLDSVSQPVKRLIA